MIFPEFSEFADFSQSPLTRPTHLIFNPLPAVETQFQTFPLLRAQFKMTAIKNKTKTKTNNNNNNNKYITPQARIDKLVTLFIPYGLIGCEDPCAPVQLLGECFEVFCNLKLQSRAIVAMVT